MSKFVEGCVYTVIFFEDEEMDFIAYTADYVIDYMGYGMIVASPVPREGNLEKYYPPDLYLEPVLDSRGIECGVCIWDTMDIYALCRSDSQQ